MKWPAILHNTCRSGTYDHLMLRSISPKMEGKNVGKLKLLITLRFSEENKKKVRESSGALMVCKLMEKSATNLFPWCMKLRLHLVSQTDELAQLL